MIIIHQSKIFFIIRIFKEENMFEVQKQIGYDIMEYINTTFNNSVLENINAKGCYQKIIFEDKTSIKYTKWRNGTMPFYIILFNANGKYLFELDLSMLIYKNELFTWNLKSPTNKSNLKILENKFGKPSIFSSSYIESIGKQKKILQSGVNVPKKGFSFLDNVSWEYLMDNLSELIISVFKSHNIHHSKKIFSEANNDVNDRELSSRKKRSGQSKLKLNLIELYNGKCAITGSSPIEVLEAAHIDTHAESGNNHSTNALLLRADIHKLFDKGLLKINPDTLEVNIDNSLKETVYYSLNKIKLRARSDGKKPLFKYLIKRWNK